MAYTWIYIKKYNLRPDIFSLCYLAVPVGNIVGNYLGGRLSDRTYSRRVSQAEAQGKEPNFEMRLDGIMLGICFFVLLSGIATFGWCVQSHVHLAVGIVCQFFGRFRVALKILNKAAWLWLVYKRMFASARRWWHYRPTCSIASRARVLQLIASVEAFSLTLLNYRLTCSLACNFFVRFMLAGVREIFVSDMLAAIPTGPLYTVSGILVIPFALSIIYVKRYFLKWKRMREERTVT